MNIPCRQSFHVIQAINILLSHPTTKNCNAYIIKNNYSYMQHYSTVLPLISLERFKS